MEHISVYVYEYDLRLVLICLRSFNGHHGQWFDKENTQLQGCCMKLKKY